MTKDRSASRCDGRGSPVRGAIGYDGQLELIDVSTPFRKELNVVGITAMFGGDGT